LEATCQIGEFEENLYRIVTSKSDKTEKTEETMVEEKKKADPVQKSEDLFLIATSEQPISALYMDETLEPVELPKKFVGYSTCFRKEAGAHGKDTWGIYRVHQFEKVEQFLLTHPTESWQAFTDMMETSKDFYQSLKLPYRVINIVSGALNDAAAKKQDLEAWFPGYAEYKELVSCSNCTDYQSRNLNIKLGNQYAEDDVENKKWGQEQPKDKAQFVHLLNGTLVATTRTLCCILENYQTPEGIVVPEVLRPFMGIDLIPFVNPRPENPEDAKNKAKDQKKGKKK